MAWSDAVRAEDDGKLRIICFGAHPDDAEYKAGGVAAKWSASGHHVKFVSVTNGDIGHWQIAGGPLAQRRTAEVKQAAKALGIESEVLDIHDGELLPTLENRRNRGMVSGLAANSCCVAVVTTRQRQSAARASSR